MDIFFLQGPIVQFVSRAYQFIFGDFYSRCLARNKEEEGSSWLGPSYDGSPQEGSH